MGQARLGDSRGMVGYSPAILSQRLTAALHQLESTDESLRQLTEIDRVRAVSLAQQETVSLAQILKVTFLLSSDLTSSKRLQLPNCIEIQTVIVEQ